MPYKIIEIAPNKHKVLSLQSGQYLSKRPLSYKRALAQMRAVILSEKREGTYGAGFFSSALQKVKQFFQPSEQPVRIQPIAPSKLLPSSDIAQQFAEAAYSMSPPPVIADWQFLYQTPTLKFYKRESVILVAIRGTADARDAVADANIPFNMLPTTDRYRDDKQRIEKAHQEYPNDTFVAVGHSLGGAIIDRLLEDGLITEAISFNGAVEPTNFQKESPLHHRIYKESDPLYQLMGRQAKNVTVRPGRQRSIVEKIISGVPLGKAVAEAYHRFKSHSIKGLQGGGPGSSGIRHINRGMKGQIAPLAVQVAENIISNRGNPVGMLTDLVTTASGGSGVGKKSPKAKVENKPAKKVLSLLEELKAELAKSKEQTAKYEALVAKPVIPTDIPERPTGPSAASPRVREGVAVPKMNLGSTEKTGGRYRTQRIKGLRNHELRLEAS
jgi:hypothetical protein